MATRPVDSDHALMCWTERDVAPHHHEAARRLSLCVASDTFHDDAVGNEEPKDAKSNGHNARDDDDEEDHPDGVLLEARPHACKFMAEGVRLVSSVLSGLVRDA